MPNQGPVYTPKSALAVVAGIEECMALLPLNYPNWIIDTGATNHMTSNLELLTKGTVSIIWGLTMMV